MLTKEKKEQFRKQIKNAREYSCFHTIDIALELLESLLADIDQLEADKMILQKEKELSEYEVADGCRHIARLSIDLGKANAASSYARAEALKAQADRDDFREKYEKEKERADRLQVNWENEKKHVADMREALQHGGELARENQRLETVLKGIASTNKRLWEVLSKAFNKIPGWDEEYRALLREPVFPAVVKIQKMEEIVNLVILANETDHVPGPQGSCPGCSARLRIGPAVKEYQAL